MIIPYALIPRPKSFEHCSTENHKDDPFNPFLKSSGAYFNSGCDLNKEERLINLGCSFGAVRLVKSDWLTNQYIVSMAIIWSLCWDA